MDGRDCCSRAREAGSCGGRLGETVCQEGWWRWAFVECVRDICFLKRIDR